jgi:hypothetical protein
MDFPKNFEYNHKILWPATALPFLAWPVASPPSFFLEHNDKDKSSKDTMFLKCIGPELFLWEYLNLGIGSIYRHFEMDAGRHLSKTGANTIFEKTLLQKLAINHIWRGSHSGPNPSTSRPRIKNYGRTDGQMKESQNLNFTCFLEDWEFSWTFYD